MRVNGGSLAGDIGDGLVLDSLLLLLVLPVHLGLSLALGLKCGNNVLVLPAGLGGETANWGVLAVGLELDLAVARRHEGAADLVVWGGDALEGLNIQNMYTFIRDERTHKSGQYTRCTWALATRTTRRASPRVASTSRV